ncbi:hypothetical protein ACLE20_09420 [Rhizobium sp. YIM 134829]|uniref:hypothetical protein n=1 Tax=Rhizobium sp. YIM 134829 TaxID=3390453 RepID=UPI00397A3ADA
MRKFVTAGLAKALAFSLALWLGLASLAEASDLDGVRLMRRHDRAPSGELSLRNFNYGDRDWDRGVRRSRVEANGGSRDGVYGLRTRDRRDRFHREFSRNDRFGNRDERRRFADRRDWPREYREDRWSWSNRDVRRRAPLYREDVARAYRGDDYDRADDWYGGADFPSVIPGSGTYAGGLRAWVEPGNGTYFSVRRVGEDGVIHYRNRSRGAEIIDARRDNRSCSFEAGVCVIRGR